MPPAHRSSSSNRSQRRGRSSSRRSRRRSSRGSSASSRQSLVTSDSAAGSVVSSNTGTIESVSEGVATHEETYLGLQHCRTIHYPRGSTKFKVVCCNQGSTCPKSGHKRTSDSERGPEGFYKLAKTKVGGTVKGGILTSHETKAAREVRLTSTRESNRELQAGLQGLQSPNFFDIPGISEAPNPDRTSGALPTFEGTSLLNVDEGLTHDEDEDTEEEEMLDTVPETEAASYAAALQGVPMKAGAPSGSPDVAKPSRLIHPSAAGVSRLPTKPSKSSRKPSASKPKAQGTSSTGTPAPLVASTPVAPAVAPAAAPAATPNAAPTLGAPVTPAGMDPSFALLTGMIQQMMQNQNDMMKQIVENQSQGLNTRSVGPSAMSDTHPGSAPMSRPPPAPPAASVPSTAMAPTPGPVPPPNGVPPVTPAPYPGAAPTMGPSILKTSNLYATQNPVAAPKSMMQQSQDASNLQNLLGEHSSAPQMSAPVPSPSPSGSPNLGAFAPVMDPSVGSKEQAYGLQLCNAVELTKGLAPAALGTYESAKRFCEGLNDVCAQPNIEGTSAANEVEQALTSSLRSITNNRDALSGGAVDSSYGNSSRNALKKIKKLEDLSKLLASVNEEQQSTMKTMLGDLATTLQFYLNISHAEAVVMVHNSVLYRIGQRTLEIYLLFLSTMLTMGLTQGWDVCKVALKYHSDKLGKIRVRYSTRAQVLAANYVHLRENMPSNFCPPDFLRMRMDLLQKSVLTLGDAGVGPSICSHCNTMIHGEGPCPWQQETAQKAQKAAAKALREGVRKSGGGNSGSGGGGGRGNRSNTSGGSGSGNSNGGSNNGGGGGATSTDGA